MKFGDAPGQGGRNALLGALATAGILKGKKGGDGLSARDRAALMDREHAQRIETMAFGHTFGETAAGAAAKRQASADRRKHKQGKEMVTHTETEKRATSTSAAQDKRDTSSHHFDLINQADTSKIAGMNVSSGQATFREPPKRTAPKGTSHPQQKSTQFSGVGEPPATPLDHLG